MQCPDCFLFSLSGPINWLSRREREMRGRMFECLLEGFSVPPSLHSLFLPMRLIAGVFTYGRLCGQLWRLLFNYCKLLFAGIASGLTGRLLSINLWFNNPFFDCKSGRWYRYKWLVLLITQSLLSNFHINLVFSRQKIKQQEQPRDKSRVP